jgi:hypothetical protein
MRSNIFERVLIIADDFTGANDTAVKFANLGFSAVTTLDLFDVPRLFEEFDIVAVDTESRALKANRAYYNKEFDVVVAMYHDQGHIATKMVGFMTGVNLSIGLPIIRAAPDHGTVWGKAGKGTADERATLEAIKLVIDLVKKTKGKIKKELYC